MNKTSLIAAAIMTAWAGGLAFAPSAAFAEGMRADNSCNVYNCPQGNHNSYGNDGGLGRYCPPGYYPHVWPNGNGVRCEAADGSGTWGAY